MEVPVHSVEDALDLGRNLGIEVKQVDIRPLFDAYLGIFRDLFGAQEDYGLTQQNIQSRIRGVTLMALSNKFGHMVVTTGNKSEMAVGYATLYGDMCGGYNALKDFYKTEVFELAKWRNTMVPRGALGPAGEVIPERIITKPPSAELREDQRDDDSPSKVVASAWPQVRPEYGQGSGQIVAVHGVRMNRESEHGIRWVSAGGQNRATTAA